MDAMHVFEQAGLGKAPFRFVGYEERKFQACPGAPIQPGGSCDFCGTGIVGTYWIQSSDGRKFKVGCDCVRKTGDKGLLRAVNQTAIKKTHARQDVQIEAARQTLTLPYIENKLAEMPHPKSSRGSALEYVNWMMKFAGRKGKCQAAKLIMSLVEP